MDYIAFSKGRIVASGSRKVMTGSKLDSLSDLYQIGNTKELYATEQEPNQAFRQKGSKVFYEEVELDIDHTVSPGFKLVVFAKYENTTIEDSSTYDIEPCQTHRVTSSWSTSKVYWSITMFKYTALWAKFCRTSGI